jgi:pimeloyl-ACP methyl ester carboxylesterase
MKHLLLLHGAIGSKEQLQGLAGSLAGAFHLYSIDFSGHGGQEIEREFSIEHFAGQILQWLRENAINKINIFGYSMGGYVAMYLAAHHPELVDGIITLATKYEWTEDIAAKEASMLNPLTLETKVPEFAAQLQQRHHPSDWKVVLAETARMLHKMGQQPPLSQADFNRINCRVLLLLGDRDKMVTQEETMKVYKLLPQAQLEILPNTPHPIEKIDVTALASLIKRFLQ